MRWTPRRKWASTSCRVTTSAGRNRWRANLHSRPAYHLASGLLGGTGLGTTVLSVVLAVLAIGLFIYKSRVLGFPVSPVEETEVWNVEAALSFDPGPAAVKATLRYDEVRRKLVIDPKRALRADTTYKVLIRIGVKDLAGNNLDQKRRSGLQPKRFRFTTR